MDRSSLMKQRWNDPEFRAKVAEARKSGKPRRKYGELKAEKEERAKRRREKLESKEERKRLREERKKAKKSAKEYVRKTCQKVSTVAESHEEGKVLAQVKKCRYCGYGFTEVDLVDEVCPTCRAIDG